MTVTRGTTVTGPGTRRWRQRRGCASSARRTTTVPAGARVPVNLTFACRGLDGMSRYAPLAGSESDDPTDRDRDCNCPDHSTSRSQQKASQASQCVCRRRADTTRCTARRRRCAGGRASRGVQARGVQVQYYDNANKTCPPHWHSTGIARRARPCQWWPSLSLRACRTASATACPGTRTCRARRSWTCVLTAPRTRIARGKGHRDWQGLGELRASGAARGHGSAAGEPVAWPEQVLLPVRLRLEGAQQFGVRGVPVAHVLLRRDRGALEVPPSGWQCPGPGPCGGTAARPWRGRDLKNCSCIPGPRAGGPCRVDTDCINCAVGTASSVEARNYLRNNQC
jgi:hypothetical protein